MKIFLRKNEHRRVKTGHLWIFSNEIERTEGYSKNGCIADLYSSNNSFIGRGIYNKNSLISFRLLTNKKIEIGKDYFLNVIREADNKRKKSIHSKYYRAVNGESDCLPGLIIDRYETHLSFQIFPLGLELLKDDIIFSIKKLYSPECIIERNEFEYRKLENLERIKNIVYGNLNDNLIAEIDDIKYKIDLINGQKTGFYLDQRKNRLKIRDFVSEGDSVLDVFCNDGGFGLNLLKAGAAEVTFVDSSNECLLNCKENCRLNDYGGYKLESGDAFQILRNYVSRGLKYDIIILDPPSFTKSKKNIKNAEKGYIQLNSLGFNLLKPNSILFTFSCSHHISEDLFRNLVVKAANNSNRKINIIGYSELSPDHPVLPQMPETSYLKGFLLYVS